MKFFRRKDKKNKKDGSALLDVPGGGGGGGFAGRYPYYDDRDGGRGAGSAGYGWMMDTMHGGPTRRSAQLLSVFPGELLERIFGFVCPHAGDESYETCEQSALDDACMLCDLRDLSHCAQVSKRWRANAIKRLYHSIRIDSVHYCEREGELAEKRKRRSFFDRNGEPEDTAQARLKLLCRTLREDPTRLGTLVRFFKTPYMLRESCQADLARTIAVLPKLLYVDLPEGLFADEPPYATLRLEVTARCPDLRKMTYMGGSERSLELLARGTIWRNLEVLELVRVNIDPAILRHVLAAMENLHALKITQTKTFADEIFVSHEMLPPFPPLTEFVLTKTPKVTAAGLLEYLSRQDTRRALRVLTLSRTGVHPANVQQVLAAAPALKTLAISEHVTEPFHNPPGMLLLTSNSLRTLRFEISADPESSPYSAATSSYYNYLAASLLGGGLPNLRAVYVRDPTFPDQLSGLPLPPAPFGFGSGRPSSSHSSKSGYLSPSSLPNSFPPLPPPLRPQTSGSRQHAHQQQGQQLGSNNPFKAHGSLTRTLEVFTKSDDGMDWSFVKVSPSSQASPPSRFSTVGGHQQQRSLGGGGGGMLVPPPIPGHQGQSPRPISSYGLGADVQGMGWGGGGARRSVMVGNGAGGFLAVPMADGGGGGSGGRASGEELWPRPRSSAGDKAKGSMDLWR